MLAFSPVLVRCAGGAKRDGGRARGIRIGSNTCPLSPPPTRMPLISPTSSPRPRRATTPPKRSPADSKTPGSPASTRRPSGRRRPVADSSSCATARRSPGPCRRMPPRSHPFTCSVRTPIPRLQAQAQADDRVARLAAGRRRGLRRAAAEFVARPRAASRRTPGTGRRPSRARRHRSAAASAAARDPPRPRRERRTRTRQADRHAAGVGPRRRRIRRHPRRARGIGRSRPGRHPRFRRGGGGCRPRRGLRQGRRVLRVRPPRRPRLRACGSGRADRSVCGCERRHPRARRLRPRGARVGIALGSGRPLLEDVLVRVYASLGADATEQRRAFAASWHLSSDVGHSVHPNYPHKHDPVVQPLLGRARSSRSTPISATRPTPSAPPPGRHGATPPACGRRSSSRTTPYPAGRRSARSRRRVSASGRSTSASRSCRCTPPASSRV